MTHRMIPLAEFFSEYTNGDDTNWADERAYLYEIDGPRLAELTDDIRAHGIREPIRVCDNEKRVIDGHHRALIAEDLGLAEIPIANAWEGGWWMHDRRGWSGTTTTEATQR